MATRKALSPDLSWSYSKNKTKKEVVVFIHHFGGNSRSSQRHQRMVNEFGFDAVSFTLSQSPKDFNFKFIVKSSIAIFKKNGILGIWTRETLSALEQIDRPVILYSFSSPSLAQPEVITLKANQVRAWICDGGPFFDLQKSFFRLFTKYYKIKNPFFLYPLLAVSFILWRIPGLPQRVQSHIQNFPQAFPLLSLRGEKDPLVPPYAIDLVFNRFTENIQYTFYNIKNAGHLNGLIKYPELYKQQVKSFLNSVCP